MKIFCLSRMCLCVWCVFWSLQFYLSRECITVFVFVDGLPFGSSSTTTTISPHRICFRGKWPNSTEKLSNERQKKTHFVSVYPAPASAAHNECFCFIRAVSVCIDWTDSLPVEFRLCTSLAAWWRRFSRKKRRNLWLFSIDKSKRQNVRFVASHMNHCSLDWICFTVAWNAPIFTNINTLLHWNTLLTRSFFYRFAFSLWRSVRSEFIQFCSMDFFPLAVM